MGARIVAGLIVRSRILYDAGIMVTASIATDLRLKPPKDD
jgi:hypothetical protein